MNTANYKYYITVSVNIKGKFDPMQRTNYLLQCTFRYATNELTWGMY